jgi:tripartite-type tricarboxylate transporter receptor subunit TctC
MANWIKGAIKHPGAFTRKAKSHGMSVAEFAAYVKAHPDKFSGQTRRQAALAKTLRQVAQRAMR